MSSEKLRSRELGRKIFWRGEVSSGEGTDGKRAVREGKDGKQLQGREERGKRMEREGKQQRGQRRSPLPWNRPQFSNSCITSFHSLLTQCITNAYFTFALVLQDWPLYCITCPSKGLFYIFSIYITSYSSEETISIRTYSFCCSNAVVSPIVFDAVMLP